MKQYEMSWDPLFRPRFHIGGNERGRARQHSEYATEYRLRLTMMVTIAYGRHTVILTTSFVLRY